MCSVVGFQNLQTIQLINLLSPSLSSSASVGAKKLHPLAAFFLLPRVVCFCFHLEIDGRQHRAVLDAVQRQRQAFAPELIIFLAHIMVCSVRVFFSECDFCFALTHPAPGAIIYRRSYQINTEHAKQIRTGDYWRTYSLYLLTQPRYVCCCCRHRRDIGKQ